METTKNTFEISLESDPKNVARIENFLNKVNKVARLDDVQFHKVFVSATEAVNNAIIHGNQSKPEKLVQIRCVVTKQYILLRVKDEGRGFDPTDIPNPIEEENLLMESGRGIFLMKTLMDEVEFHFNQTGTEVLMALYIGPKKGILNLREM